MTIEEITKGLKNLLVDYNYSLGTIHFYEREWNKIRSFLSTEYGDTEFNMERGLAYLEKQYGFQTKYNDGTLSQQRVQLLRVVHMLEDYHLHQVLTRRYYASKNPIRLNGHYSDIHTDYVRSLSTSVLPDTMLPYPECFWITSHREEYWWSTSRLIPAMRISEPLAGTALKRLSRMSAVSGTFSVS